MIEDRIAKIRERLAQAGNLSEDARAELLDLLHALEKEIATLPETHREDAHSIARFAEASTLEATRDNPKEPLLEAALKGLSHSVEEFEVSHPALTGTINRMAMILSNMGI